jgi:hypothetical protein
VGTGEGTPESPWTKLSKFPADELWAALDPVPPGILGAARATFAGMFSWELAELTFDSLVDAAEAGVEDSPQGIRELHFCATGTDLELLISRGADGTRVHARVDPPRHVTVQIQGVAGMAGEVAGDGRFLVTGMGHGRARFVLPGADDCPEIRTDWVRV